MNPLQALYKLGLSLDRKFTTPQCLGHPVVSIGNISVGGRAKTPMVIDLCIELKKKGYEPVVLTRGYARKSNKDTWLLPESLRQLQNVSVDESGDEALEIFLKAEVAVLISADRAAQAKKYSRQFKNPKIVFVLDDGFQHWKIKRDFDLVMVSEGDYRDGLLPTGRLRECVKALERADLVLQLGKDVKKVIQIKAKEKISPEQALVVTTRAGSQGSYQKSVSEFLGFSIEALSLRDHLRGEALKEELTNLPAHIRQLVLGIKEAVKLFAPAELQNNSPLNLDLPERSFSVFIVELQLDYDREKLFNLLQDKVLIK